MQKFTYLLSYLLLLSPILYADSPHIQGVVIYGEKAQVLSPEELQTVRGVKLVEIALPGKSKALKKQLNQVINEAPPLTTEGIEEIKQQIHTFYTQNSHPFILIKVPEQDISEGIIQLRVVESHVGEVYITGNQWYPSGLLKKFVGVKPGDLIDQSLLLRNLYFINQNAFLQGDLIFSPGEDPYTTDITLAVQERRSVRFYAGVDNTGIKSVERNRWFMGVNWGNAFGLGDTLSYQYTASFNRYRFQGITVQYIAPLSWHHTLNIYGGYARVHPHLHVPSLRNKGWSYQTSLRYQMPLPVSRNLKQNISVGGDFKRTNNTFLFSDSTPRSGQLVNLTQVCLEYTGNYTQNNYALNFDTSVFWSPASFVHDQSNFDYRQLRAGAKHRWVYIRSAFSYLQNLPAQCSFYLLTRGQFATQNLLPSEQYGIGGFDTVRGYEERQLNKDSAVLGTIEIRSPKLPVISAGCKSCNDMIQFLAFLDFGWGTNHKEDAPHFKTNYLLGVGPGIRYSYNTYLTARFDAGYKVKQKDIYPGGSVMFHFSVIGSY